MRPPAPDEFFLYVYAVVQLVKVMQKRSDWPWVLGALTMVAGAIALALGAWEKAVGEGHSDGE